MAKGKKKKKQPQDPNAIPGDPNGTASDLLVDSGQLTANDPENWQPYFNKMLAAGGLTAGAATPFGQWLQNEAYRDFEQRYKNAMLDNNLLKFTDFANQAYGDVGAGTVRPATTPMGVGQPMNTGNPFTSSSGIGYSQPKTTMASATAAAATTPTFQDFLQEQGINKPKGGFNKGRKKRLLGQYNAFTETQTPTPATATPASPAASLDDFRKKFLSLDPETRGEPVMGVINAPARWSAWG